MKTKLKTKFALLALLVMASVFLTGATNGRFPAFPLGPPTGCCMPQCTAWQCLTLNGCYGPCPVAAHPSPGHPSPGCKLSVALRSVALRTSITIKEGADITK